MQLSPALATRCGATLHRSRGSVAAKPVPQRVVWAQAVRRAAGKCSGGERRRVNHRALCVSFAAPAHQIKSLCFSDDFLRLLLMGGYYEEAAAYLQAALCLRGIPPSE
ncbi:hypothetical protein ACK3TF_004523 [Chlorella vulgaris]